MESKADGRSKRMFAERFGKAVAVEAADMEGCPSNGCFYKRLGLFEPGRRIFVLGNGTSSMRPRFQYELRQGLGTRTWPLREGLTSTTDTGCLKGPFEGVLDTRVEEVALAVNKAAETTTATGHSTTACMQCTIRCDEQVMLSWSPSHSPAIMASNATAIAHNSRAS